VYFFLATICCSAACILRFLAVLRGSSDPYADLSTLNHMKIFFTIKLKKKKSNLKDIIMIFYLLDLANKMIDEIISHTGNYDFLAFSP
jgi:hypothetical protein